LTEETDAVAIIVSEATGTPSIAMNGEVERGFDEVTLRTRLRTLLGLRRSASRRPTAARTAAY
jgi:hypothetical protein